VSSPFFIGLFSPNAKPDPAMTVDYSQLIERKRLRLPELESNMAQDGFFDDPRAAGELTREYNRLKTLLEDWEALAKARIDLADNLELAKAGDVEMAEMAAEEIPALE
jgi:protein subunit release factor A